MTLAVQRTLLLLVSAVLVLGCASSQTVTEQRASEAAAIGTWEYEVSGPAPLARGTFSIHLQDGRLSALVRDQYRGRFPAEVRVHSSRMELTIGHLQIDGTIDEGRFSGFIRPEEFDASIPYPRDRRSSGPESAYISAERVQSMSLVDPWSPLDCRSILREDSGCL